MKEYLNYINNFRGFVIVLIVGVHCISSQLLDWTTSTSTKQFFHALLHGSSIFYIFIAGFLFQLLLDKYKYFYYLKRKFMFIFLPYFILSVPAVLDEISFPKEIFSNLSIWEQLLIYYSTGIHMSHFWFIPMICIYYLISPIFALINKYKFYYIIPILMIMTIFIPREISPMHNPILSALHFLVFYVFGMLVSYKRKEILKYSNYYPIGIIIFGIFFYLTTDLNFIKGNDEYFLKLLYVIKFNLISVTLVCFFYKHDQKIGRSLNFLAGPSFGIYFLHNYFIVISEKFLTKYNIHIEGNIATMIAAIFFITYISYLLVIFLKKSMGKKSKVLIGY